MSNGFLLIAQNNGANDYIKQAVYCAKRIKQFCNNASVSIITSSKEYLEERYDHTVFDHIVDGTQLPKLTNNRLIFDGALSHRTVQWKNVGRDLAYELSPYDETIILDTDYIVSNNSLANCFGSVNDIMMFKKSEYLGSDIKADEFTRCADASIDFWWATIIYFKKSKKAKIFFDLVKHIRENWFYYNNLYQINSSNFRNDFAFSIAIHTMNSMRPGNFVAELPGKMYFIKDQDFLENIDGDKMTFLVGKKDYLGEYTLLSTQGLNVHVLNKASLERQIG
jgi:hypothetical protein